ncbi:26S proteasome regulatory subunit 4 homolog A-like [Malus domestica]|uniref:26S proteasome regulatory subunit 4 homolog A-like n=1 Tax=Malus domestica TaxID=3750 RepID=UPI0039772046
MGQGTPGGLNRQGLPGDRKPDGNDKKEKKFEPAASPARVGRKQLKQKAQAEGSRSCGTAPDGDPLIKCKLQEPGAAQAAGGESRIKDYLLMAEEFVTNQERFKPQEEKAEEDRSKVDDLRGSPMSVGNLEELIDENHAIISSSVGPEYYVGILMRIMPLFRSPWVFRVFD